MGIYLYNVNIQKNTALTIKIYPDGRATCDDGKYLTHVIITEVKPSHGRLIDIDKIMDANTNWELGITKVPTFEELVLAPIVIESEEGE